MKYRISNNRRVYSTQDQLRPEFLAQVFLKLDELKKTHMRLEFNEQANVAFLGRLFSGVGAEDGDGFYFEELNWYFTLWTFKTNRELGLLLFFYN